MAIINISVVQFLPITQNDNVQDSSLPIVVSQSLTFSQVAHSSIQSQDTNQPFNLHQVVALGKILNLSIVSVLNLTQQGSPTYDLEAQNVLHFVQVAASVNPQATASAIHITQSVVPSRALENALTISQTVSVAGVYNPSQTTSSITITQGVAYFKTDAVNLYNIPVPDPIDYLPVILTLGASVVTLKIPEIGDSDKIQVKRVQEQTRGGDTIIFRDPIWSITETLKYKFVNLTRARSQQLLSFFAESIGLSVQLRDHQGVTWNGIITTPDAQVVCINDNNCGSYDVEFEFQGTQA
jgi:hypothetical protein